LPNDLGRRLLILCSLAALLVLAGTQAAAAQTTYTLTVTTNSSSYAGTQNIVVSGSVTPPPGPNTAVTLKIINPLGVELTPGEAYVNATTGDYSYTFVSGGTAGWITGTYNVTATWGAYSPQIFAQKSFNYSSVVTSTSTTSTTTLTTTTSTTSTTTTTSTSSTSSSSSTKSGGIPEFPFEGALMVLFVALLVSAYLVVRRFTLKGRAGPRWVTPATS
jgi:hypothetical protein